MQVIYQNIFDAFLGIFSEGILKKKIRKITCQKVLYHTKVYKAIGKTKLEKNILKFYFQEQ